MVDAPNPMPEHDSITVPTSESEQVLEPAAEPTLEPDSEPTLGSTESVSADAPKPIAEFAGRPDFPACTLNENLDIGGFTGVVIKIINQSLKVKSPEGAVQSFNAVRLRKIYGPVIRPEFREPPAPTERPRRDTSSRLAPPSEPSTEPEVTTEPEEAPRREYVESPNFEAPLKPITEFAGRVDFPQCVMGEHLEINEFTGVAVEIVKQSLKVRSPEGFLRSYNIPILRKLYGKG